MDGIEATLACNFGTNGPAGLAAVADRSFLVSR
jgi:hypothetical protein